MIDIGALREYYKNNRIIISAHALKRLRERNIKQMDIRNCIMTGEIIEQYPDDFPFPSCLIYGLAEDGSAIHVVASDEGTSSRIITAYIPDTKTFENDFKTRRRDKK